MAQWTVVHDITPGVRGQVHIAGRKKNRSQRAWAKRCPAATSLRDVRGNRRTGDLKGSKALVVAFLASDCPISNLYLPELIDLEKKYRSQGVQFVGVYPNDADDLDRIASHAYDRDTPFLVLKDNGQKLADSLGVTRVAAVVVLDGDHVLRYRGRVDDQYGAGARRPKATRDDLSQALDEVLAGKKVSVAETEADGCLISRAPVNPPASALSPTASTSLRSCKHAASVPPA